jgi:hypothetical protein
VTGIEALGRGNDLTKLNTFLDMSTKIAQLPPEINKSDALTRVGTALGIDMKGLVKSQEEVQAEMEQQQMQAMIQQGIPNAINAGGRLLEKGMEQGAMNGEGQPTE